MKNFIILSIVFSLIKFCNSLTTTTEENKSNITFLPYPSVPSTISSGDKISIPVANENFIISDCAALGNTYLYNENNEITEFAPVSFFNSASNLELYIPEVTGNASMKYFIVVQLPLANSFIKTGSFTITSGSEIKLPKKDSCGKNVKYSNKENTVETIEKSSVTNDSGVDNNDDSGKEKKKSNMTLIAISGTSVVAFVVVGSLVFLKRKSYMKASDYNRSYSTKPFNEGSSYNHSFENSERDYQLKCLNETYPVSLSDTNMDKTSYNDEYNDEQYYIAETNYNGKGVFAVNREKYMSEYINETENMNKQSYDDNYYVPEISKNNFDIINKGKSVSDSIYNNNVKTSSIALIINECSDIINNDDDRDVSNSKYCSTCSCSYSCSSCSCSSCSSPCRDNDDCSCCDDSRRNTQYTDRDSRRYTDYTNRDSRYTDYSNRDSRYTDYTNRDSRYTDANRDSRYTDANRESRYTEYTNRDSRYTDANRESRYTDYTNRDSRYTDANRESRFTDYTCRDSRYTDRDSRYPHFDSKYYSYIDIEENDNNDDKRQTVNTDGPSDFFEAHEDTSDFPSMSIPNPLCKQNTNSMTDKLIAIQSKQNFKRASILKRLPDRPTDSKPPEIDLEFIALKSYQSTKTGELSVNEMDILNIIENLEGGCYMVSNATTGMTGKIPAHIMRTLL